MTGKSLKSLHSVLRTLCCVLPAFLVQPRSYIEIIPLAHEEQVHLNCSFTENSVNKSMSLLSVSKSSGYHVFKNICNWVHVNRRAFQEAVCSNLLSKTFSFFSCNIVNIISSEIGLCSHKNDRFSVTMTAIYLGHPEIRYALKRLGVDHGIA